MSSVRRHDLRGTLFLDFRYRGKRCREYTAMPDTPVNRLRLQKIMDRIDRQIEQGKFDYAASFGRGAQADDSVPVAAQATLAKASLEAARAASSNDAPPQPAPARWMVAPPFSEYAARWTNSHEIEWRRSHLRNLRSILDGHLLPRFKDVPINRITKADVYAFRSELAKLPGRKDKALISRKRINNVIGPLKQILNEAAEEFDFVSPVATLKPLKVRRSDISPFTLQEVEQLLVTVRADYRDYLVVRFFTGMRSGEVDGLKWKYVDFDRKLILVREALVLGEDDYTKNDGSQRDIRMSTPVFEALKRQEAITRKISEYVFCNRAGNPLDNKNFTERVWYPLLRHLGLALRRPYQTRHTAATLWLAACESPEWIARQLGHVNTTMLFSTYSRFVPNLTRQDGSAMERLLRSRFDDGPEGGGQ